MGLKSMLFELAVRKLAPKLGRALMGAGKYGKHGYARGYAYPAYGYTRKPKSRGVLGLVKRALKKMF
jgi:hypothetical protein